MAMPKISEIKRLIKEVVQWRHRLLVDGVLSMVEAILVLIISYLYLIVLSINYGLDSLGVSFFDAVANTINSTLRPTEMITYVTGILSSTTAYFVIRLLGLRKHIKRVLFILLFTAILFWLATPLFISGLENAPANQTFAVNLAKFVGVGALGIWLYSLFSQRRIFEKDIDLDGDRRGKQIADRVRASQ